MSDRVGVMNGGKLEQVGAPYDVYQRPRTFFVADFVGAANCLRGVVTGIGARGTYTVQLTADDRVFTATGVPDLALGAPVAALARPEAGKVNASDAGNLCARGNIADVSYAGPQIAYRVSSNGLGDLSVFCKADASSGLLEVGRSVELSWDTSDLWIFPVDEPSTQPGPEAEGADAP